MKKNVMPSMPDQRWLNYVRRNMPFCVLLVLIRTSLAAESGVTTKNFTSETSPNNQISMQNGSVISTTTSTTWNDDNQLSCWEEVTKSFQIITRDYQYKRREWSFVAIKYEGFLQFFGKWRLVTRLGGTYSSDGSIYYNKWNWDDALDTLTDFLSEMEKYHRVYRLFAGNDSFAKDMDREWSQRYPRYRQQKVNFMMEMSRYPLVSLHDGTTIPGFIVPADVKRMKEIETVLSCNNSTRHAGAAVLAVFNLTHRVISESQLMQSQIKNSHKRIALTNLKEIIQNYVNLSALAWDDSRKLGALNVDGCAPRSQRLNSSDDALEHNEVSKLLRSLSRQVLGHLLLLLKTLDSIKTNQMQLQMEGNANNTIYNLRTLFCRIIVEDIDESLEENLEQNEMTELGNILQRCQELTEEDGFYLSISNKWREIRTHISNEYSAFRQYSNRIPEILFAKSIIKAILPVIAVIGFILNSLIIYYYAKYTPIKKIGRHLLLVLLAIFDIFILLISMMVLYTDNYMEHNTKLRPNAMVDAWCKFHSYILNLVVETAAFLMVILSLERCLAVLSFFRYNESKTVTYKKLSIMALSAFCFTCIFNCMMIIGDELAAPARSTVGHQCVHYVRLTSFDSNLAFTTRVKPILNTLVRSLIPYNLVFIFNLITCWHVFKKGNYFNLYRQEEETREMELQSNNQSQLNASIGQLCLSLAYLVLTAPAPVVYTLFMTAHGDRLMIKLTNGLYDEVDPVFRSHWKRIGQLTVAQYVTEYVLIPISASINFFVFYGVDQRFKNFILQTLRFRSQHPSVSQDHNDTQDNPQDVLFSSRQENQVYQLSETVS